MHHIIFNSHHMSSVERHHIASGAGFHEPMRYSELPRYYYDHITPPDVAMFQVAPMDEHGWFNFGPGGSHLKAVCECAKTVIVEVNKNMPVCLGGFENCIHIDDVDMIVEGENPALDELGGGGAASEVDMAVAKLVVELMGGEIGVNTKVGEGSEFYFTLNKKEGDVEHAKDDAKTDGAAAGAFDGAGHGIGAGGRNDRPGRDGCAQSRGGNGGPPADCGGLSHVQLR